MINITDGLLHQYYVKPTINTTTMTVEQIPVSKTTLESQLTDAAAAGFRLAKRVLWRSAVMFASDSATPADVARFIPVQRVDELPPPEIQVELHRRDVISSITQAFDLAVQLQIHSNENYIMPSSEQLTESEYICIASEKNAALYLHRPTVDYQHLSKHPFWLRELVTGDEQVLGLPTRFFKDFGIDATGNIEERELITSYQLVDRLLEPYDALPYYRALRPVQILAMTSAE